jgi:hypothetical protein
MLEQKSESEPFSFVPLLTSVKFEVGSAVGMSVSRCLPDSSMGRGGVIEVRLADHHNLSPLPVCRTSLQQARGLSLLAGVNTHKSI